MDSSAAQQGAKQTAALGMAAHGAASHPAAAALHVQVAAAAAAVAAAQQQAAAQVQRQEVVVEAVAGPGLARTGSLQPAPSPTDLKVRGSRIWAVETGRHAMHCWLLAATGRTSLRGLQWVPHRSPPHPAAAHPACPPTCRAFLAAPTRR